MSTHHTDHADNHLLVIDLAESFNITDSSPYSTVLKGPQVPNSLAEHAIWYSPTTRKLYQLGGMWSLSNTDDPGFKALDALPEPAIWQYDINSKTWSESTGTFDLVNTGSKIQRPGAAAYCDAPAINMSFVFQGYVETRSDKEHSYFEQWSDFMCNFPPPSSVGWVKLTKQLSRECLRSTQAHEFRNRRWPTSRCHFRWEERISAPA